MNTLKKSTLQRPAKLESPQNCAVSYSKTLALFGNGCGYSANANNRVAAPVSGLLFYCRPAAVARLVVAVVVWVAVYGQAIGGFAHVGQEVLKLSPPLADNNPATTVSVKAQNAGVVTPPDHVPPDSVGSAFVAAAVPMLKARRVVSLEATTGMATSCLEVAVIDSDYFTALTEAHGSVPHYSIATTAAFRNSCNFKSCENCSDGYGFDRHNSVPFIVVISGCGSGDTDRSHDSNDKGCENKPFFPHNST